MDICDIVQNSIKLFKFNLLFKFIVIILSFIFHTTVRQVPV